MGENKQKKSASDCRADARVLATQQSTESCLKKMLKKSLRVTKMRDEVLIDGQYVYAHALTLSIGRNMRTANAEKETVGSSTIIRVPNAFKLVAS